jgi:ADP-heptose:LPS heptosyltransferase
MVNPEGVAISLLQRNPTRRQESNKMLFRLLSTLESVMRRRAKPEAVVKQVLILEYLLPLGCCVHLTPVFEALRRCRPDVKIILATRGLNIPLNRHSPWIDVLLETPDPFTDLPSTVRSLRAQLKRLDLHPDCVLTGASDRRTRIALLALLSSRGWRGGFTLKPALYQRPLDYDPALSLIRNNLRLTEFFGCSSPPLEPNVALNRHDIQHAAALLSAGNPHGLPLAVLITQNSGGQSTGWHTERWVEVIHAAVDRGLAVIYAGTSGEAAAIEAIINAADNKGTSIAGSTTVAQLAAVLAQSDIVITLDTGPMHVGRAIGVPMVVLGPSWQKPVEWLPLGIANVRILRGPDRDDIPPGYRLDEIPAASVVAAMDDLLTRYPPSSLDREQRRLRSLSDRDILVTAAPTHRAS